MQFPRLNYHALAGDALDPMLALEANIEKSGFDPLLINLVRIRASQINGSAFCLHVHSNLARRQGESEEQLHVLPAWRNSSLYSERERAALAWTECLTNVAQTGAPDAEYRALKAHFSEAEILHLTLLIISVNAWNRFAIGFRAPHPLTWNPRRAAA